ncbi:hypothetical protein GOA63_31570 [Sinorhizobium meliloti]|uniref:alpha-2,8-polysialyltransferase family protein n=1 Tax=Rhizobium meliloti TaxID=382 RepID=UPI000411F76C|nr:alpha-2,8-polysialyltransferase family protein [Sinorhizobium meliloti]MDE3832755.1 hypothetical protein [Sinorhizobium meliloti]MDE4581574.1 alpha-2,8-polysialyltransferase family protein [Sinorhizobium meliloti]MDW9596674.1 hypothetical protein [Sinorhizobium meliloti]MDX0191733.1 hypothetical protein [Sinorhizobium meliloti]RVO59489.1 hypothetical protein CN087_31710 [Sinorhizobium meliloti]
MISGDVVGGAASPSPTGTDLIIISNGRQAQNAFAFINEFGDTLLLRPFVLALYTDANLKERSSISNLLTERNIPHGLLRLPVGAAYFSLRKQSRILSAYRSAFAKNVPRRLFLFNYNTHYGLVYDLAKMAEMQVFYIEEGLSSYKRAHAYAPPRSLVDIINKDIVSDSLFGKVFLKLPFEILSSPKTGMKTVLGFIQKELSFFARCIVVPFDNEWTASRLKRLFSRSYRYRRFHEPISGFNGVFGTFPERLAKRFDANEVNYFSYIRNLFRTTKHHFASRLAECGMTAQSLLYVDQDYKVDKEVIIGVVAKCIHDIFPETDALYIKPHPKSDFSLEKLEVVRERYPEFEIKLLPHPNIPAEFIPALTDCRRVIGIASTALVYASDLRPDVEAYSIYRQILPLIAKDQRTAKIVAEHGSVLEDFNGVQFV